MATKNNKSASASATTKNKSATTKNAQNLLTDGKFWVTISNELKKCIVETKSGVYAGTLSNTKPTTHIKWSDNNGNKYDILAPTDITIDGQEVTTKYLTQNDFENFLTTYAKKSFLVDKTINPKTKSKKLDLHTIPEFADKVKKIDELQKQINDIMQSIKTSDTYKQLTQTERQKQARVNLIDRVKKMIASGAIKIDDLQ